MALTRLGPNNSSNISGINLTSQVTGTLPTGNGGTGATSFSPGKLKQVVTSVLAANTYSSSSSAATVLTLSFTPTSASTQVAVFCNVNTQLYGNNTATNFGGYLTIRKEIGGSGSDITKEYYDQNSFGNSNTSYISIPAYLSGIFTPGATTQCDIYLRYNTNGAGRIGIFGNDDASFDNPTRLIAMEYST